MKKILITGASGFLGSRLAAYLRDLEYTVFAPSHTEMDLTSDSACLRYVSAVRPDAVVHCAALSDVRYCEEHPEESYLVNVKGTVSMARAAKAVGARFLFMSSDQVYTGTLLPGLLREDAPLAPVNHYGRHKLQAEQRVMELMPEAIGLRLTWMYDQPSSDLPHLGGILCVIRRAYEEGRQLKANPMEHRGFTDVWRVARNIERLLHTDAAGIYNFGSPNGHDAYTSYCNYAARLGLPPTSLILPDTSWPGRNLSIDISRLRALGLDFPLE